MSESPRAAWVWPVGIFIAGLVVVGVNVTMIVLASSTHDPIAVSYTTEAR